MSAATLTPWKAAPEGARFRNRSDGRWVAFAEDGAYYVRTIREGRGVKRWPAASLADAMAQADAVLRAQGFELPADAADVLP